MSLRYVKGLCVVGLAVLAMGCAMKQVQPMRTAFDAVKIPAEKYVPNVDNFLVILDDSASMGDMVKEQKKIDLALDVVHRLNQTLPELGYMGGLRTFGQGECLGAADSSLLYGMTKYSTAGMDQALQKINCIGGNTPMEAGFEGAMRDFKDVKGKTAVIVVSDGIVLDEEPVLAAEQLKKQLGDNLCIYTVQVGNDPRGKMLLEKIAKIGACGFATNADEIYTSKDMAGFVELVFLAKAPAKAAPPPPPPPPPAPKVMPAPAPMDRDGDGVTDDKDACPDTPKGAKVDEKGCWVIGMVHFDFDKANIKPAYQGILNEVAKVMSMNPGVTMEIDGHTDSTGPDAYNQKLSERRAKAAMTYLVEKGIAKDRFMVKGFSFHKPIASNDTKDGRAKNRRDEFIPSVR
jgi:OOP family OmpA-OmpF porin